MSLRFRATSAPSTCLLSAIVMTAAGCSEEQAARTATVVLDSNYGDELTAVVVALNGSDGQVLASHRFEATNYAWPLSLGVELSDEQDVLRLTATALGAAAELSQRSVHVSLAGYDGAITIPIFLDKACAALTCGDGLTCTELGCADPTVDWLAAAEGGEFNELCRPHETWCDIDGSTLVECTKFGAAPTRATCPNGCVPGAPACGDGTVSPPVGVAVEVSVGPNGRLLSAPSSVDCVDDTCTGYFPAGSTVWLQPVPDPGYEVDIWSGDCGEVDRLEPSCRIVANSGAEAGVTFRVAGDGSDDRPGLMDINADGHDDLVVGAPNAGNGGKVYVFFGPTSGSITALAADLTITGNPGSNFGAAIAMVDANGDEKVDVLIGAPGDQGVGAVYRLDGADDFAGSRNASDLVAVRGTSPGGQFGAALSTGVDVTSEAGIDLVVGAPNARSTNSGLAYLFKTPHALPATADEADATFSGEPGGGAFGHAVALVHDMNGDGTGEIAIADPMFGSSTGRVYIVPGEANLSSGSVATRGIRITHDGPNAQIGIALAPLGPVLGQDGLGELAIGSRADRVVIVLGTRTLASSTFDASRHTQLSQFGEFGVSLMGGYDVTGDGVPDLAVGAPSLGGPQEGGVFVYSGTNLGSDEPYASFVGNCAIASVCNQERLGVSVGVAGDLDGDGVVDLAMGSAFSGGAAGATRRGRVTVYPVTGPAPFEAPSESAPLKVAGEDIQDGAFGVLVTH